MENSTILFFAGGGLEEAVVAAAAEFDEAVLECVGEVVGRRRGFGI